MFLALIGVKTRSGTLLGSAVKVSQGYGARCADAALHGVTTREEFMASVAAAATTSAAEPEQALCREFHALAVNVLAVN